MIWLKRLLLNLKVNDEERRQLLPSGRQTTLLIELAGRGLISLKRVW